jgi:hypothetical protein
MRGFCIGRQRALGRRGHQAGIKTLDELAEARPPDRLIAELAGVPAAVAAQGVVGVQEARSRALAGPELDRLTDRLERLETGARERPRLDRRSA